MFSLIFFQVPSIISVDWQVIWRAVVVFIPVIVVVLQWITKRKVNEIHVMVNSEHTALVTALAEANQKIDRLINALPERINK